MIIIFYDCILGYYCADIDRENDMLITLRAETPHLEVQWAISELPFASVSKQVLVQNHSNETHFDMHEKRACR